MTPGAGMRAEWRPLFNMPQGLFLYVGLVLVAGGIALWLGAFPVAWDSDQRTPIGMALVDAATALFLCASVSVRLRTQLPTFTRGALPHVVGLMTAAITVVILTLAAASVALIVMPIARTSWLSLMVGSLDGNVEFWGVIAMLLTLWNVVTVIALYALSLRRVATSSRTG